MSGEQVHTEWVTTRRAARILGVHIGTLRRWAEEREPPKDVAWKMNGTRWRWNPTALVAWATSRRCSEPDERSE